VAQNTLPIKKSHDPVEIDSTAFSEFQTLQNIVGEAMADKKDAQG
jgi:hypothetical protein